MNKDIIRKSVCEIRQTQDNEDFNIKSLEICNKIMSMAEFAGKNCLHKNISLYNTHKKEVSLDILRDYFIENGANCYYPVTCDDKIIFGKYDKNLKSYEQCKIGAMGIREPFYADENFVRMDWIFIPGIAFDITGNRIGYGKGYYDRYLKNYEITNLQIPVIVAPAFEFQIVDNISSENHDVPVDIIVTEKRIIFTNPEIKISI